MKKQTQEKTTNIEQTLLPTLRPSPRWSAEIINAEIAELERLLLALPSEYEGQWATFHLHRCIKAQLAVLRTGWMEEEYRQVDAGDSALWAMQWLYLEVEGLFSAMELRAEDGPSYEWKEFEELCGQELRAAA